MDEKIIKNSKKHICFVSLGHISSNPRLIKEASLVANQGYKVSIVAVYISKETVPFDEELIQKNPTWNTFIYPFYKKKGGYIIGTFLHHLFKRIQLSNYSIIASLSNLTALWFPIYRSLKSIKADLYVAHHIAMLPLTTQAAEKNNAKLGFDIEDAYSVMTESIDKSIVDIEKKYLSKVDYLTCASPLYIDFYNECYQNLSQITPILNVFEDLEEQDKKEYKDRKNINNLSLYWFSQTTGKGRGIEQIIEALNILDRNDIELHLRGNASQDIKNYLLEIAKNKEIRQNIFFHEIVSNQELPIRTTEHDIGLALETGFSVNNELAISNKIFQYINSGLAIITSKTKGQSYLIKENKEIGFLIDIDNTKELAQKIQILADSKKNNTEELESMKIAAKNLSKTKYNWNKEGQKFISVIEKTLS
ncbi:glycosyltransferase [Bernardetia sp. OM2101]|uniref:glycosyltransferase n=1 Tax=Bernardetia sp. OM2101 TaxID=3344876 RepID=UPI0035CF57EE